MNLRKILRNGAIAGLGYLLSPLSWWNDVFFNLPIALIFGYGVSWLHPNWFMPGTVIGYWLSNVVGMILLQFSAVDLFFDDKPRDRAREVLIGLGSSTLYTLIVASLVYYHVLEIPDFLINLRP